MKQKINIAELLKDCPKGMELDCTMIDNVVFEKLDVRSSHHPIIIRRTDSKDSNTTIHLTKYGQYSDEEDYKCVIYPKGKTTWEGFQRPFEDGDIVAFDAHHLQIFIFKDKKENNTLSDCYLMLDVEDDELYLEDGMYYVTRFATEEEKKKLFQAIKNNGYNWNAETKTLEKLIEPKFKVGDKIIKRDSIVNSWIVSSVSSEYYGLKTRNNSECIAIMSIAEQDEYDLVPDKFDATNFEPFMKVLVRSDNSDVWECDFFSSYNPKCSNRFHCIGAWYNICIPYIGNEHLRGTTDDCDEFYKNW